METERFQYYEFGSNKFEVDCRYKVQKMLGSGAYGVVCSGSDTKVNDRKVAIKQITRAFDNLTDCKRTLREIKILRHFDHENIISLYDIMAPRSFSQFEDVYIISDLMDTDLHQIISSPQPLSDDHCQYFLYQILRGLKCIHSANVLHRDLKPSNILLNGNCDLKICDFGLARAMDMQQHFMTEYVTTRWYRAPEVMLTWKEYSTAIDMWSVGCIFYEILARKPLFPGRDYMHQLQLISEILGTPDESELENVSSLKARTFMKSLPRKNSIPLAQLLPKANPLAVDLCSKMLHFNPEKRITVTEALEHPYLLTLHDEQDEPVATAPFVFEWEDYPLTKEMLKELIFKEVISFHPEAANDPTWKPTLPEHPPKRN